MEILSKLFGNSARVKIMRLFLLNPGLGLDSRQVMERTRVNSSVGRKEISMLISIGFLKKKTIFKEVYDSKKRSKKKKADGFTFNNDFVYASQLYNLLSGSDFLDKDDLIQRFKKVGKIKLLIVSGIFIKENASRADLLIVGNNMKRGAIDETIRKLEAEIGREMSYAVFDTKEFIYRLSMYDKLIRDILDFPHEVIIESKELSTASLKKA